MKDDKVMLLEDMRVELQWLVALLEAGVSTESIIGTEGGTYQKAKALLDAWNRRYYDE
ncbi:MAG TPA: hypothetical protein P5244_02485 [Syntrophales bacterium]|nr:hypothetical protein [Syntrophales bacterium]